MHKKDTYKTITLLSQQVWTLADVKSYMRIEDSYDDILIKGLIEAAIVAAENFTKLSIIARQMEFTGHINHRKEFDLRYKPILEIEKIVIISGEKKIELQKEQYSVHCDHAILYFNQRIEDCKLMVQYLAGYEKNSIPQSIKHGILLHVAEMYDRERHDATALSTEIKNLYLPYRQLKV